MITFHQHITEIKNAWKVTDAEQEASIKRWFNVGVKKVKNNLRRNVNAERITGDLVAGQQTYQLPEYANRPHAVVYAKAGMNYPLTEISSELEWLRLNAGGSHTGTPLYYFVQGDDEIALWPVPAASLTGGLVISYSPRHPMLTAEDVSATATVTNGDNLVTLSTSVVSSNFVGRSFKTTDGSHEHWYRISEYVSNTSFRLENFYAGASGSRSCLVGELVDLPEEFAELPALYAYSRYQTVYRKNRVLGKDLMEEFKDGVRDLNEAYARSSKSGVVKGNNRPVLPHPLWWPVNNLSE